MFPSSSLSRRAAITTSLVAGSFALALSASPAQAAAPVAGGPCPALTPASVLQALSLKCVGNVLVSTLPVPTTAPSSLAPAVPSAVPTTTAPKNPISGVVGGVTGAVNGVTGGATAPVTNAVNNAVNSLLGAVPTTSPTTPGGATLPSTGTTGSTGTSTAHGVTGSGATGGGTSLGSTSKTPSTKDGSSLLGPAAAFLPGMSLANFADLSSGYGALLPLADNIPSPLIASAESKLAAVQAPLIAASERAANQADSGLFSRFGGKALPGLLVVLATALVAAVGAGNLRAFQARFGAVNVVNLRAWKRSTRK